MLAEFAPQAESRSSWAGCCALLPHTGAQLVRAKLALLCKYNRSQATVEITMEQHHHRSTFAALRESCSYTEEIYKPYARLGLPCVLSLGPVVVGGFLLQLCFRFAQFCAWGAISPARKANTAQLYKAEIAQSLQRTAPWAQTLNALGTTLPAMPRSLPNSQRIQL
jgi:hypothetical protein